ncbi:DUF58 domain-containing protein [Mariniblastus fucicola]|uniref:VWA domain containing CoxE-like protein n=1 Tax=Mariniblastus fucicola TaxID=980251 RepID=A0A5B9PG72_9BACT|nr:DUF58 domain-containing protein [Mariniblastus fucicola]QEG23596.1 VWA domain containing CoxE-like protein [Mariniblastus fucicola]
MSNSITNPKPQSSSASSKAGSPRDSYVDTAAIMKLKNLELRARLIVEGFMSGLHRSPYHGFSVEFTDYREYSPGDDLRHLDWKLLARRDRKYIKRFEDETNLRCHLLVDLSRSMSFGSGDVEKSEYAKTLAASLAYFLFRQRDAVGLVTFDEAIDEVLPARFRPGHLRHLLGALERSTGGSSTDIGRPLEQVAATIQKRGLIVLVSDFLVPIESIRKPLSYLRAIGHDIVLLRVLDPAEVEFSFSQASMFVDLETGREIYVDPGAVAKDYQKRFNDHRSELKTFCDGNGIDFFEALTSDPVQTSLFNFLQARAQQAQRGQLTAANPNQRGGGGSQ